MAEIKYDSWSPGQWQKTNALFSFTVLVWLKWNNFRTTPRLQETKALSRVHFWCYTQISFLWRLFLTVNGCWCAQNAPLNNTNWKEKQEDIYAFYHFFFHLEEKAGLETKFYLHIFRRHMNQNLNVAVRLKHLQIILWTSPYKNSMYREDKCKQRQRDGQEYLSTLLFTCPLFLNKVLFSSNNQPHKFIYLYHPPKPMTINPSSLSHLKIHVQVLERHIRNKQEELEGLASSRSYHIIGIKET